MQIVETTTSSTNSTNAANNLAVRWGMNKARELKINENIKKIFNEVTKDRRIKLRELADIVKIHEKQVWSILHDELHMKKLSARWEPRLLTLPQKIVRWTNSEELLAIYLRNPIEFLRRFITVDETLHP